MNYIGIRNKSIIKKIHKEKMMLDSTKIKEHIKSNLFFSGLGIVALTFFVW